MSTLQQGICFAKEIFKTVLFLVASFQGRLWKPIVCHMGQLTRESFPLPPYRRVYVFAKETFRSVFLLDANLQGRLWTPIVCHTGQMAREGLPYPPYSRVYVFAKEIFRTVFFWLLIFRGASGNLQVAIQAKWQGKAFHVHPIEGHEFLQRKFSRLYFLVANIQGRVQKPTGCHTGQVAREGFPCPPCKRAYVFAKEIFRTVLFGC